MHKNGHLLLRPDGSYSATGQRYWNATDACCNIWNEDVDDVDSVISPKKRKLEDGGQREGKFAPMIVRCSIGELDALGPVDENEGEDDEDEIEEDEDE